DGVGDFFGLADALDRDRMGEPMGAIGLAARAVNFGVDQPWPDAGDADALAGNLKPEANGEGIDRALGGRVVDIGIGPAELRGDRGHIDDDAALAAMPDRHPLHRLARAKNAAGNVDRQHAPDAFGRHLIDPHAAPADNAAVVDQRAERAQFVRGLEEFQDIALLADIAFRGDRLAVLRLDRGHDLVGCSLVAGVTHDDTEAARGGRKCGGAADAAAAAGDHSYFVDHVHPYL